MTKHWIGLASLLGCLGMASVASADYKIVNYGDGTCLGVQSGTTLAMTSCSGSADVTWATGAFWPIGVPTDPDYPANRFTHILNSTGRCLGLGIPLADIRNCNNNSSDPASVGWWVDYYGDFYDVPGYEDEETPLHCFSFKSKTNTSVWLTGASNVIYGGGHIDVGEDGLFKTQVWCIVE